MDRRSFIQTSGLAAASVAAGANVLSAAPAKPNILVIIVDQMRHPMWTPEGIMPNVDRLARSGTTFDRSFTSAAPCSPSRACLWTGTYTTQNKMLSNCDFVDGDIQPSLDPNIPTMGHIFRKAGYRTPYRGKWHLTRYKDQNRKDKLIDYGFEGWKSPDAPFGGPPYCGDVLDPIYSSQACRWLRNKDNHKDPWFMVCSLVNPHDIGAFPRYYPHRKLKSIKIDSPPPNWTDDLSGKPRAHKEFQERMQKMSGYIDVDNPDHWRRYMDYYVRCLEDVDENIGDVLDALEKSGQRDNTLVIFTADHGEMAGSHKLRNKGCFVYEENMRIPLIFSMPGVVPAGATSDALVSNVDIFPTLTAMFGISGLPYMAGRDFSRVFGDTGMNGSREEIIFHNDWEIVFKVNKGAPGQALYSSPAHIRCIRDREWKYAYYFAPGRDEVEHELYNIKDDPLEMKNLANDAGYISRRKELFDRLMEQERQFDNDFEI